MISLCEKESVSMLKKNQISLTSEIVFFDNTLLLSMIKSETKWLRDLTDGNV